MRLKDYDISTVFEAWYQDGVRYRRVKTRDGKIVVEKGEDGQYVPDHIR